jgi:hypothetical protein
MTAAAAVAMAVPVALRSAVERLAAASVPVEVPAAERSAVVTPPEVISAPTAVTVD